MAKQRGFLKVEGKIDDLSFYKSKDAFLLRQKGGVSKHRIMNDPRFKRTRENGTEFGEIAKAGKLLRDANAVLLSKAKDGRLSNRMMQVLAQVKNHDLVSERGERQVYAGLATVEGKALLKGFEFNSRSPLRSVLKAPYVLVKTTGKVTISELIPGELLIAPPNATHASFKSAFLNVNFETGESAIAYSPTLNLPLDMTVSSPVLTPSGVPAGTGTVFYLLLIEFFQEMNGIQYVLSNGNFNCLTVLDVG